MFEIEKKIDTIMNNLCLGFYNESQARFLISELFTMYLNDLSN